MRQARVAAGGAGESARAGRGGELAQDSSLGRWQAELGAISEADFPASQGVIRPFLSASGALACNTLLLSKQASGLAASVDGV